VAASTRASRNLAFAAESSYAQVFENAQEFWLHEYRHLANLIKKQGAAVSLLKASRPALRRARKRTLLVSEQLALNQTLR